MSKPAVPKPRRNRLQKHPEVLPDHGESYSQLSFDCGMNWLRRPQGLRRRSSTSGSSRYRTPTPHPHPEPHATNTRERAVGRWEYDNYRDDPGYVGWTSAHKPGRAKAVVHSPRPQSRHHRDGAPASARTISPLTLPSAAIPVGSSTSQSTAASFPASQHYHRPRDDNDRHRAGSPSSTRANSCSSSSDEAPVLLPSSTVRDYYNPPPEPDDGARGRPRHPRPVNQSLLSWNVLYNNFLGGGGGEHSRSTSSASTSSSGISPTSSKRTAGTKATRRAQKEDEAGESSSAGAAGSSSSPNQTSLDSSPLLTPIGPRYNSVAGRREVVIVNQAGDLHPQPSAAKIEDDLGEEEMVVPIRRH
ncbi:hypothetical protein B0H63DRAFT_524560 [Podospora didyma]|uniref:Uncharacterized protein n=1 Tax=Podospora didyma TaxID=330526 RepID=A0AAE0TW73_9PEZI|nr:hypothetical protein B0H63DRAFT_524560 [Podospora didyma]